MSCAKQISVGGVPMGAGHIPVQSMTTVRTSDTENCVAQIMRLCDAGCDIVRVAVPDEEDAKAIASIKARVRVPIVADIHFSARLAVLAAESGADKLRVNPGNLKGEREIALVADALKAHHIPVRVGANTGSIEKIFYEKYGRSEQALVESALFQAREFEKRGVENIVLSVKASDVPLTVRAYELLSKQCDHPLHIGVTEAGGGSLALVKSAVGIGSLLIKGIGDTLRVSLSADPVEEVYAAHDILRACGLERGYVEVVSCPTCGRCMYDCLGLAAKVREAVKNVRKPLRVAVMGCVVNGPGEAKDCDLGIAGGGEYCILMKRGLPHEKIPASEAEARFFAALHELVNA